MAVVLMPVQGSRAGQRFLLPVARALSSTGQMLTVQSVQELGADGSLDSLSPIW